MKSRTFIYIKCRTKLCICEGGFVVIFLANVDVDAIATFAQFIFVRKIFITNKICACLLCPYVKSLVYN